MIEGSRLYENIFVSGGALLTDDSILKTIELGNKTCYGVQFAVGRVLVIVIERLKIPCYKLCERSVIV